MKNIGSALVDYMLPTAVVGVVVGMSLFSFVDTGTLANFIGASANMNVNLDNGSMVIDGFNSTTKPIVAESKEYVPIGSPDAPFTECVDGNCMIDFGELVIKGIPENFGELVETSGSSGGTEALASILDQIADQLEINGDKLGAQDFRELVGLSNFIAEYQKDAEKYANDCLGADNVFSCYKTKMNSPNNKPLPEDIDHLLPDYKTTTGMWTYLANSNLGVARAQQLRFPSNFEKYEYEYISYQMANIMDRVSNNSDLSPTFKGVAQDVYRNIGDLIYNQNGLMVSVQREMPMTTISYDPIDASFVKTTRFETTNIMENILNPKYSSGTDIKSILQCSNGLNKTCK